LLSATRRLRSLHFVPGGSQKFLDKALLSKADALICDLEDSVAPPDKLTARAEVGKWMDSTDFGKKTVIVRINALDTPLWEDDLTGTMRAEKPHMYMIPKASCADDIAKIGAVLSRLEKQLGRPEGSVTLLPIATEVPSAPLRAEEIAKSSRVEAITWGAEDLGAEMGVKKRKDKDGNWLEIFQLCRSLTLLAAKSANVQAIDTVFTDLKDIKAFSVECEKAADSGFDGKMTIHPTQIDAANKAFSPTPEELKEAKELLAASQGQKGAFRWKGQMVDIPHLKQAQRALDRADGIELEEEAPKKAAPKAPYYGKWLEELEVGTVIQHALTRTITETDNILFTTLSLNPAKLHLDYESAKGTQFKKPLVNSMYTVALLVGMSVLETTHGTTVANLGFEEVVFPKPCFYGDTIRAETEVIKVRPSSSNPNTGIVTFEHRAYNQEGALVCKAKRNAMMNRRPSKL